MASHDNHRGARTVVLKLKTKEFKTLTRSLTPPSPPASEVEFAQMALSLRDRVELGAEQLFRLIGVGLANFNDTGNLLTTSIPLFELQTKSQDS
jgi:DNA polymerase IV